MSGEPYMAPGVWQSLQPTTVVRYLPRSRESAPAVSVVWACFETGAEQDASPNTVAATAAAAKAARFEFGIAASPLFDRTRDPYLELAASVAAAGVYDISAERSAALPHPS